MAHYGTFPFLYLERRASLKTSYGDQALIVWHCRNTSGAAPPMAKRSPAKCGGGRASGAAQPVAAGATYLCMSLLLNNRKNISRWRILRWEATSTRQAKVMIGTHIKQVQTTDDAQCAKLHCQARSASSLFRLTVVIHKTNFPFRTVACKQFGASRNILQPIQACCILLESTARF